MAVFNEQFSNGIPFMDASTKRFISELNKLADSMKNGEGREYVIFALDYLKSYCADHLSLENKVMLQYEYYDSGNHNEAHMQFCADISSLREKFDTDGADHGMPLAVQRLMADWLIRHISKNDKVLGDFLRAKLAKQKK